MTQWFYFAVSGAQPGVPYTLNIVNFLKKESLYTQGKQPLVTQAGPAQMKPVTTEESEVAAATSAERTAASVGASAVAKEEARNADEEQPCASGLQCPGLSGVSVGAGMQLLNPGWWRHGSDVCYYPSPYRGHALPKVPQSTTTSSSSRRSSSKTSHSQKCGKADAGSPSRCNSGSSTGSSSSRSEASGSKPTKVLAKQRGKADSMGASSANVDSGSGPPSDHTMGCSSSSSNRGGSGVPGVGTPSKGDKACKRGDVGAPLGVRAKLGVDSGIVASGSSPSRGRAAPPRAGASTAHGGGDRGLGQCYGYSAKQLKVKATAEASQAAAAGRAGAGKGKAAAKSAAPARAAEKMDRSGKGQLGYDEGGVGPGLYCLTFRIVLPHSGWFLVCNCYPYTYTDLQVRGRKRYYTLLVWPGCVGR